MADAGIDVLDLNSEAEVKEHVDKRARGSKFSGDIFGSANLPIKDLLGKVNEEAQKGVIENEKYNSTQFLSNLADIYLKKAEESGQWTDFFKAHGLFNACGKREPEQSIWYDKAFEVECKYQNVAGGKTMKSDQMQHKYAMYELKTKLRDIRNKLRSQLSQAEAMARNFNCLKETHEESTVSAETQFCTMIKSISEECCEKMVSFAADVMDTAVKFSGEPACEYAVVAIGSLARSEITPYSDLEYFILTENNENLQAFERLAVTSYFIINNLQECNLKIYDAQEFPENFKDNTKSGFEIDGLTKIAGNIPTGHGPGTVTNNKFIKTVDEMVSLYEECLICPAEDFDLADLSAKLASTICVYGKEELHQSFICGIRNAKTNEARRNASLKLLQSDVRKFKFLPDESLSEIKHVKKDIFRFPSIIIYDLKIIYQLT